MSRGPLFSGHTYSRVSKNCRSMRVSALRQSACGRSTRTDVHCFYWNTKGFFLVHFHIYNEFTIPQLPSCFDKFSWTESLVRSFQRSGIDSRLSLFLRVLRKNNQNTKDSLRSWRDLWRISASFHGCFRCFSLSCKPREQLQDLNWDFSPAKKQ